MRHSVILVLLLSVCTLARAQTIRTFLPGDFSADSNRSLPLKGYQRWFFDKTGKARTIDGYGVIRSGASLFGGSGGGAAPTGAAGGILSGSYPNPGINATVLGTLFKAGTGLSYDPVTRTYSLTAPSGTGPQGPAGTNGLNAEIFFPSVSTLPAGSSVTIGVTGTPQSRTVTLGIPRGDKGDTGTQGPKGDTGPTGPASTTGTTVALTDSSNTLVTSAWVKQQLKAFAVNLPLKSSQFDTTGGVISIRDGVFAPFSGTVTPGGSGTTSAGSSSTTATSGVATDLPLTLESYIAANSLTRQAGPPITYTGGTADWNSGGNGAYTTVALAANASGYLSFPYTGSISQLASLGFVEAIRAGSGQVRDDQVAGLIFYNGNLECMDSKAAGGIAKSGMPLNGWARVRRTMTGSTAVWTIEWSDSENGTYTVGKTLAYTGTGRMIATLVINQQGVVTTPKGYNLN